MPTTTTISLLIRLPNLLLLDSLVRLPHSVLTLLNLIDRHQLRLCTDDDGDKKWFALPIHPAT